MSDAFLSYNSRDRALVTSVAEGLRRRGIEPFFDRWALPAGRTWQGHLSDALASHEAAVIFLGPNGLGSWQKLELNLALNRHASNPSFPVIPVLLPGCEPEEMPLGFLVVLTWIDLRTTLDDGLDQLAAAIRGEPPHNLNGPLADARSQINPYRGLHAFREEDAPFFFGREAVSREIAAKIKVNRFVAVIGASGSGKSSLVKAGVIPQLRNPSGDVVWAVTQMRPTRNPLCNLAEILAPLLTPHAEGTQALEACEEMEGYLRKPPGDANTSGASRLGRIIRRIVEKQRVIDRVLLFIDQFEEIFPLAEGGEDKDTFINEVVAASQEDEVPLHVIVTLRDDHYNAIIGDDRLRPLFTASQVGVGQMQMADIAHAIAEPAAKLGLTFQPGLPERILDEMQGQEDALPLLQYLLEQLWQQRSPQGALTHIAYENLGGVQRAIASRATAIYNDMPPEQQAATRDLLLQLVRPGQGTYDSKRSANLGNLDEATRAVVDKLSDWQTRLLVARGETVEIAHEALIREWDQLRRWVNAERDALTLRDRLDAEARRWIKARIKEPASADELLLPHGIRLEEARTLRSKSGSLLVDNEELSTFIEASIDEDERRLAEARVEREAREHERDQQLKRTKRQNRRLKIATGVALGAFACASGALAWANMAREKTDVAYGIALGAADQFLTGLAWRFYNSAALPRDQVETILTDGGHFLTDMAAKIGADARFDAVEGRFLNIFADITFDRDVVTAEKLNDAARDKILRGRTINQLDAVGLVDLAHNTRIRAALKSNIN